MIDFIDRVEAQLSLVWIESALEPLWTRFEAALDPLLDGDLCGDGKVTPGRFSSGSPSNINDAGDHRLYCHSVNRRATDVRNVGRTWELK